MFFLFFVNDTATTEIYTLSLHDALPISLEKSEPRAFDDFLAAARDVPEVVEIQTFLGRVEIGRAHV